MTPSFSNLLTASEGRFASPMEEELATAYSLEQRERLHVSRLIEGAEFNIVDYATQEFCDIMPAFDGPKGSMRRKKGHQDGRIMLRYIAHSIREGSPEAFFEKVLSWLVGHLDDRNVTGFHMEIFVHFIHQGTRRELPENYHGFVDGIFEEVIGYIRRASFSGSIQSAHRRIAEYAVDRVMDIMPDVKTAYGLSSAPKCKRDFEILTKEVARLLKSDSQQSMNEQFAAWLIDRLMNQVSYDHKVWHWSFLSLREAVIKCCGAEAGASVSELFETMADRSEQLVAAVTLANSATDLGNAAAEKLLEMGHALGLLRKDEFITQVGTVNRDLLVRLAVLQATGTPDDQLPSLADTWCWEVCVKMPSREPGFLAANLKLLLEAAREHLEDEIADRLQESVLGLVNVARRTETAERLIEAADKIAHESTQASLDALGGSAAASRSCYRDMRLSLARVAMLLPAGPSSVNGHRFREYLVRFVLPNEPATPQVMEQAYRRIVTFVEEHLSSEDARLVRGYFENAIPVFAKYAELKGVLHNANRHALSAVERGYQVAPRHESLRRHGIEAGKRDGAFLLEKTMQTAVIAGPTAEAELHRYFRDEQVRLSKLPGGVIIEFVRGLQEQVRDHSEMVQLLVGLAKAAPAYSAALKLNAHSQEWATEISNHSMKKSPAYAEKVGEKGLAGCVRDYSVMIRGLSGWMQKQPFDVEPFREWWHRRIGNNIRNLPEAAEATNLFSIVDVPSLLDVMAAGLDHEEHSAVSDYLNRILNPDGESRIQATTPFGTPIAPAGGLSSISYADVGV